MSTKKILAALSPEQALKDLKKGHERFKNHEHITRDFMQEVQDTVDTQYPFAIILGCIDSRVPVEILFDQGIGDLFVTRVAGNFENDDILASMEYACEVTGSKLIVVLGHESCGAVKAACDDVQIGHITGLLDRIKPAIAQTKIKGEISSKNAQCINDVAKTNVKLTIDRIRLKSTILNKLEQKRQIKIVGAYYSLSDGVVEFMNTKEQK